MATVIEVDWFNTYLLKKLIDTNMDDVLAVIPDGVNGYLTTPAGMAISPGIGYPGTTNSIELNQRPNGFERNISSGKKNALLIPAADHIYVDQAPLSASVTNGSDALFTITVASVEDVNNVVVFGEVVGLECTTTGVDYEPGDILKFTIPNTTAATPVLECTLDYRGFNNYSWYVEESRIRGGYNNTSTDKGVKAYVNEPEPQQQNRFNSLIYSGLYNSRTGINNTNVFSVAEDLVRSADPQNGSIQKTYSEDTNLIVFQENKISRALIDKDTIYTTEGGTQTQAGAKVLGQIVPYKGEYGISNNPESFAVYGYRKYFSDRDRNAIMRLSGDGLTEISAYGMTDYFRDELALIVDDNSNYVVVGVSSVETTNIVITLTNSSITADGFELTNLTTGMNVSFSAANGSSGNLDGFVSQVIIGATTTEVYLSEFIGSYSSGTTFRFTSPIKIMLCLCS